MSCPGCLATLFTLLLLIPRPGVADAADPPLAEKYLTDGKLAEGAAALDKHLKTSPDDDQARFGLGVVQFFQAFENLGTGLHGHGLRSERAFGMLPREVREFLSQHPDPQPASYPDIRQLLTAWVADLNRAEATLAGVKDDDVKLPLHVGKIQVNLLGPDNPVSGLLLVGELQAGVPPEALEQFVIALDRGDVCWLRGYCHFLAGIGEVLLAVDGRELFERTGHLFFEKVDTPHKFLQEEPRRVDTFNRETISDVISFIHSWRFPMQEPKRMQAALAHFEAMLAQSQDMWKHYAAETDDDREWIPNPKQTGVVGVAVSQEMINTWLATVAEAELVMQGKKLVPFWRGQAGKRGLNVRRIFTEPKAIDPIYWIQGTAATPYLEEGEFTELANPDMFRRINDNFGGINFFGFAFWFN